MPFNHLTIDLEVSHDEIPAKHSQEIVGEQLWRYTQEPQLSPSNCKIAAFAQIAEDNFCLLLLLTSGGHLLAQHKVGVSSRFASVPIETLFPEKHFSLLSLLAITVDCLVTVCISSDGQTIFLIPFCAFMDVTWSRATTPLASHPIAFDSGLFVDRSQLTISAAHCARSSTGHMYLILGDMNGSLFVSNLNLRVISVRIDLANGICSIHAFAGNDGKHLLISLSDGTQLVFAFEKRDVSVRETLLRNVPSQTHQIANDLNIFPQLDGSVCVMDSSKNKLSLFDSLHSVWSGQPRFCLDSFGTNGIRQVICLPRMIVVLTLHNRLFVRLRFSRSDCASVCCVPMEVNLPSQVSGRVLHVITSTNSDANGENVLECFSAVTETGLFTLTAQKTLNDFIIAHLSSQFFSANSLSAVADSLRRSPAQICLSLLHHSLRNPSVFDTSQTDGIISLAFKCNIDPNEILSVLHANRQGQLLLPFLRIKIEKDSCDESLHKLFLGAIFGRIAQISEEEAKEGEKSEGRKALETEKDALECELRSFLLQSETDESEILLLSLRNLLFSCVCVFLFRNSPLHSPTVVRFLLESPIWESTRRQLTNLLKCLSLIHWPSVDSHSAAVLAKLLPFVPSFNIVQLKSVNKIADLLAQRSVDSAQSLRLMCSLRLFHFSAQRGGESSEIGLKVRGNSVDSGPNCTTLIGEDVFGFMMSNCDISDCVEFRPFFWGEFSAGTHRLLRNEQRGRANEAQCPGLAELTSKNGERSAVLANCTADGASTNANRWARRKQELANPFALSPTPKVENFPNSDLTFCAVACGTEHVLLLTVDGRLFSWGRNRYGQCGNGSVEPVTAPIEIKGRWGRVVSICAGHYHSGFITESEDVYLWGWGLHGQLGNGGIADHRKPSKSRLFTALASVRTLCLGYSHTLALCVDGRVFGCGALSYGQLGIDPHALEGSPTKALKPVRLPLPMPISLIASKYFHGIALGVDHRKGNVLFEWGISPQSLKMKTFLKKRLQLKQKEEDKMMEGNGDGKNHSSKPEREDEALSRVHLRIRKLCQWDGGAVKALSAGFNHSALLTTDGQLFTWGKSLEMQLGHRNRKECCQPTKVDVPQCTRWSEVVCAHNFTTAVSAEGKVFVWGRNDKFQLGLGKAAKKRACKPRIITLKSESGKKNAQRSVELPVDNCVETPTIVQGLRAFVGEGEEEQSEKHLAALISSGDQNSLDTVSHLLIDHPTPTPMAVRVHLMSGALLAALRLLVFLLKRDGPSSDSPLLPSNWSERPVALIDQTNDRRKMAPSANLTRPSDTLSSPMPSESKRLVTVNLRSAFCSSSSAADFSPLSTHRLGKFYAFVDKIWALLRVHPIREVQTYALIELLHHGFPIHNRLAKDLSLCRLVDPFLTFSSPTESAFPSSLSALLPSSREHLTEISIRQRAIRLRHAKVPDLNGVHLHSLRDRCDKLLAQQKWCFFSNCGHFEKRHGPVKLELADKRNKRRECSKCVSGGRAMERKEQ